MKDYFSRSCQTNQTNETRKTCRFVFAQKTKRLYFLTFFLIIFTDVDFSFHLLDLVFSKLWLVDISLVCVLNLVS